MIVLVCLFPLLHVIICLYVSEQRLSLILAVGRLPQTSLQSLGIHYLGISISQDCVKQQRPIPR